MKNLVKFTLIAVLMVLLATCTTYYGPRGLKGGYSEQQIDNQTVQVMFEGNQQTTVDELRTLLTYRCAEVTLAQGYNFFKIIKDNSFDQNGRTDFAESHIAVNSHASMSGGLHTHVSNSFTTDATNDNLVGVYVIRMTMTQDPVYPSASIDARAFMEVNKELIPG